MGCEWPYSEVRRALHMHSWVSFQAIAGLFTDLCLAARARYAEDGGEDVKDAAALAVADSAA